MGVHSRSDRARCHTQLASLARLLGGRIICSASISFARRLESYGNERLAFIIGGADGLTADLKAKADWRLSLSPMTFPHELARLMLIEQLFRAQAIIQGSPYHRA